VHTLFERILKIWKTKKFTGEISLNIFLLGSVSLVKNIRPEPAARARIFVYGAQELIPRNEFRQPM
jgi:hypothetical protein